MTDTQHAWLERLRGRFVVFDGPDGSGKSTQFRRLADLAGRRGLPVCEVREPGGTQVGEQLREILLNPHTELSLVTEMLLYMASRAQLVAQRIEPALRRGELILADRFISSTLAYQGMAGGLPIADIEQVGRVAVGGVQPHLVVLFDVDEDVAAQRLVGTVKRHRYLAVAEPTLFSDRMELKGMDYQRRVRRGYLEQARRDPEGYLTIDAEGDADTVFARLLAGLEAWTAGDARHPGS